MNTVSYGYVGQIRDEGRRRLLPVEDEGEVGARMEALFREEFEVLERFVGLGVGV